MRSHLIRFSLALAVTAALLPLLAGCGSKEEKNSSDYYSGPMQGKGSTQNSGTKKPD